MKKVALLAMIAAVTLSASAQAKTVHYKQHVASNQSKQCFIPTDNRGYGYWVSCGSLTQAQREQLDNVTLLSANGGGGGGGGGGGR
jgi:hypothetical protein